MKNKNGGSFMKYHKSNWFVALASLALLILNSQLSTAFAQGTAFTYQGRLNSGTNPAAGLYDFQFALSNAPSGGSQIGVTVTNPAVVVTNGLFTTTIDFGSVFAGQAIWLAISVRTNGAGSYVGLTPLQPLTATPYAVFANSARGLVVQQNSDGAPNVILGSSANFVSGGVEGATIAGGGATNYYGSPYTNSVTADFGTVSGGAQNFAEGFVSTVVGGTGNIASGDYATVGGGYDNTASGEYSFAAGNLARATNDGSFVWADSQSTGFYSTNNDSFNVMAHGGASFVTGGAGMSVDGSLTIAGISQYNSGLKLTGSTANGTGIAIESTAVGGHKYDLISGGASSAEGAGAFELYDETINNGFDLTVATNGNVGIGTTTPAAKLEVNGNAQVDGTLAANYLRAPGAGINSGTYAFIQRAVSTNTFNFYTVINNPITDNDPNAILIITHNFSADTNSENVTPVGVFYNAPKWTIINEDNSPMALGRAFNVLVIKP
jgi:hypothetical protein